MDRAKIVRFSFFLSYKRIKKINNLNLKRYFARNCIRKLPYANYSEKNETRCKGIHKYN